MAILDESYFLKSKSKTSMLNFLDTETENLKYALKQLDLFLEINEIIVGYQTILYKLKSNDILHDYIVLEKLNEILNVKKVNFNISGNYLIVEIPNPFRKILFFGNSINNEFILSKDLFDLNIGVSYKKEVKLINIRNKPLIITGIKNSGKKNLLNVIIANLLLNYKSLAIDLIDTNNTLSHLYSLNMLNLVEIPDYLNNIDSYLKENKERVIIINDLADLQIEIEQIRSLIKYVKAFNIGIVILSSSVKQSKRLLDLAINNISLELESATDSKDLIGIKDGVNLLGKGDMLVKGDYRIERIQATFFSNEQMSELIRIVSDLDEN